MQFSTQNFEIVSANLYISDPTPSVDYMKTVTTGAVSWWPVAEMHSCFHNTENQIGEYVCIQRVSLRFWVMYYKNVGTCSHIATKPIMILML